MAMGIAFADDVPSPKNSLQCDQQLDLMLPEFFFKIHQFGQSKGTGARNKSSGALNRPKWQNISTFKRYSPQKKDECPLKRDHFKKDMFIFQASTFSGDIG